ncbi:MAG: cysteine desulfurase [Clostridiales bacterium]|jgi:cysteine desulfurase|nr:cysteine desulfurase [Clostridiales bacterium]
MIFFDNAATTPCLFPPEAENWGNPSSPHARGLSSERLIKNAREILSGILNGAPDEIFFTSGGTESNNLAILGTALRHRRKGGHIIATPYEHPSVLQPLARLKEEGFRVTLAPVSEWQGLIDEDTLLVSVSQVHNETGGVHPVSEIAESVKKINPRVTVHVDGAQGFCKEAADLSQVDSYAFSAHKIHGAAGVGGLMVRRGVKLVPLMYGGGQQNGLRPGTENVPGIVSLTRAAEALSARREEYFSRVSAVRSVIAHTGLPDVWVNTLPGSTSPYILSMSFLGVRGETLTHALSGQGIYISTGSACNSRKKENQPLSALGLEKNRAESSVRFSFSHLNTMEEAETVRDALIKTVTQLRNVRRAQ